MNQTAKNKTRRLISRGLMALVGLAVVFAIVQAAMPKPTAVDTANAERGPMTVTVDEDGRTRVKDRYILSAPLPGNLARVELVPGAKVTANDIVARLLPLPAPLLDPRSRAQGRARLSAAEAGLKQAQAAVAASQAALDFAESDMKRNRQLAERGSIPKQRLDRAELELRTQTEAVASATFGARVAKHEVQMARAAVGHIGGKRGDEEMPLVSPVAGIVLDVLRENEGVVQAGAPVLEVGDPRALEIVVDVLTTDAVRIVPGAKARLLRWGGDGDLDAHVTRVDPKAFTRMSSLGVEEQRVNVVIDLDAPREQWSSLGDGFRVEASIVIWEKEDALSVPIGAVFKHDGHWAVFVVNGEVARRTAVEVGRRNGVRAQIASGLEEGQTVVLHPGERITDGAKIAPR